MKSFNTVLTQTATESVVQKSRFIAYIYPVRSEEEAAASLDRIRKVHWDATHHVPAWIMCSGAQKFSDDGEPGGTAGLPVLEALRHGGMENCMAVVVRYFGGTKLGTGGLVRAYGHAVREALQASEIYAVTSYEQVALKMEYTLLGKVQSFLCQRNVIGMTTEFSDLVMLHFYVIEQDAENLIAEITNLTNDRVEISRLGSELLAVGSGRYFRYNQGEEL